MQRCEEAHEGPVPCGVADQRMAGDREPRAVLGSQDHQGLGVSRRGPPAGSHPKPITLAAAGSMASGRGRRCTRRSCWPWSPDKMESTPRLRGRQQAEARHRMPQRTEVGSKTGLQSAGAGAVFPAEAQK